MIASSNPRTHQVQYAPSRPALRSLSLRGLMMNISARGSSAISAATMSVRSRARPRTKSRVPMGMPFSKNRRRPVESAISSAGPRSK
jgi:hypothetical protein